MLATAPILDDKSRFESEITAKLVCFNKAKKFKAELSELKAIFLDHFEQLIAATVDSDFNTA